MSRRSVGLAAALTLIGASLAPLVGPDRLAAQEEAVAGRDTREPRDTAARPVASDTVFLGQELGYRPPGFLVDVTLGMPGSAEIQGQTVRAVLSLPALPASDSALLERSLSLRGGVVAGAAATLSSPSGWGVRVGGMFVASTLVSTLAEADDFFAATPGAIPAREAAVTAVGAELDLRYWLPSGKALQPYLDVGTALSRWTADGALPETTGLADGVTRWEAVVGLGGVLPLSKRFYAHFRASRRLSRSLVDPWASGETLLDGGTLVLIAQPPLTTDFADGTREVVGVTRLEVGLSAALGSSPPTPQPTPAPEDPDEEGETPPPPGP